MSIAVQHEVELLCSVRAADGWFGILTTDVREVLGVSATHPVPLAPAYIDGVIPYRGDVLTTVNLRAVLGLKREASSNCILVLDDEENEERFGLAVDSVGGVVSVQRGALEPNPTTLDARSTALFRGSYRTDCGLMVRLDPHTLRPAIIAKSGRFSMAKQPRNGETR